MVTYTEQLRLDLNKSSVEVPPVIVEEQPEISTSKL